MLQMLSTDQHRDCDGKTRRDFLKVGALGATGLTLPHLLQARAQAAEAGLSTANKSIVWLWLSGGPTHIETFDPKMTAPVEYRSVTGEAKTNVPGVTLGGQFTKTAQVMDKFSVVRSFAHNDSGHGSGTHYVMTGYSNRNLDNGGLPSRPSIGSIAARHRGANHPVTGMPTYVRLGGIGSDGPAFLGKAYAPFGSDNTAKSNMRLATTTDRIGDRRELLSGFDRLNKDVDQSGIIDGLDAFEKQAFELVLGNAPKAFDLKYEDPKTVEKYGSSSLAKQMLTARRLCEAGCGFVTLNYGGWDMHGKIADSLKRRGPEVDHAVATFIEDVHQRGLSDDVMLVVTGEFGRTPKINKNAGRDHWGPLCTLGVAGGGLPMGQVVGESDAKATRPASDPITPQDFMATLFQVLGIPRKLQYVDQAGRPVYMIEDGDPIREYV